jgi:excisionase family DNA binding protein
MTPQEHLASLVGHPERALNVPPEALPAILIELASLQSAIAARAGSGWSALPLDAATEPDRLLTVKEAAAMLGVSKDFLYGSPAAKPLRVRLGTRVMFSQQEIQRFIRRRAGRE